MFARILSGGVCGVEAYPIEVEVDCCGGIGQFSIVGLPDASVKESQDRVKSAIKSCDLILPPAKKWVVNLAPADTRKEGPSFDLPIAMGVLVSCGLAPSFNLPRLWMVGELGLDGSVRPVSGVLPIALRAKKAGVAGIIVPDANAGEAGLVQGLAVYPVSHLQQAKLIVQDLANGAIFESPDLPDLDGFLEQSIDQLDFKDVKGQNHAKRALEIAAAGRHNILMVGPPGSGKSMLAERLPGIMPPLTLDEALELTKLYSVAGMVDSSASLIRRRPFRAPHHSSSPVGLVGGGKYPRPGEISLSHLGILFLDELTEFPRTLLDNLRQPLESARVTISRAAQTLSYPASFLLAGACNPCPCGYRGDPIKYCTCTPGQADRYWSRLSGPLLDRIDLQVEVARLNESELASKDESESSGDIRTRVNLAVRRQYARNKELLRGPSNYWFNGCLPYRVLMKVCEVSNASREFLARAITQLGLSARAYDRVLRIARTIADLEGADDIGSSHLAEALRYRVLARVK